MFFISSESNFLNFFKSKNVTSLPHLIAIETIPYKNTLTCAKRRCISSSKRDKWTRMRVLTWPHEHFVWSRGGGDNESVSGFSLTRIRFRGSVKGAGHGAKNLSCTFSPWSFPFHGRFRCSDTKREEGSPFT